MKDSSGQRRSQLTPKVVIMPQKLGQRDYYNKNPVAIATYIRRIRKWLKKTKLAYIESIRDPARSKPIKFGVMICRFN